MSDLLTWRENTGIENFELLGLLKGEQGITLYIIRPDEEDTSRFELFGAFIPDFEEATGMVTFPTIEETKTAAESYTDTWLSRRFAEYEASKTL